MRYAYLEIIKWCTNYTYYFNSYDLLSIRLTRSQPIQYHSWGDSFLFIGLY